MLIEKVCVDIGSSSYSEILSTSNSLLLDSGTIIAEIAGNWEDFYITMTLVTRGGVCIEYNGYRYRKPGKFPKGLRKILASNPNNIDAISQAHNIHIVQSNWLEYVYEITYPDGKTEQDSIMCKENIADYTGEQIVAEMTRKCEEILNDIVTEIGVYEEKSIVEDANDGLVEFSIAVNYKAVLESSVRVPPNTTFEEALDYAREHLWESHLGEQNFIPNYEKSDFHIIDYQSALDVNNCTFVEEIICD